MPFGWRIVNAARQDGCGGAREFISRSSFGVPMHGFEHLKQPPALPLITFAVQNTFSFEIHIIDKCVTSLGCFCQALNLLLHVESIGGRRFASILGRAASNLATRN